MYKLFLACFVNYKSKTYLDDCLRMCAGHFASFLNRSNFNNNAYRNNFGSNNYKPYPPNNGNSYGNSYVNSDNRNKNVSSDVENVLKEFITSQKAFNKTVEEKLENWIDLSLKWKILLMMLKF